MRGLDESPVTLPCFRIKQLLLLFPEILAQRPEPLRSIDELHLASALVDLAIGYEPDVSSNTGVVEHVERKRDDRIQPIVFDQITAHVALTLTGVAGEKR